MPMRSQTRSAPTPRPRAHHQVSNGTRRSMGERVRLQIRSLHFSKHVPPDGMRLQIRIVHRHRGVWTRPPRNGAIRGGRGRLRRLPFGGPTHAPFSPYLMQVRCLRKGTARSCTWRRERRTRISWSSSRESRMGKGLWTLGESLEGMIPTSGGAWEVGRVLELERSREGPGLRRWFDNSRRRTCVWYRCAGKVLRRRYGGLGRG